AASSKHDLASVVSAMNAAATRDLPVVELLPLVEQVLATGPAPNPRDQTMVDLLEAWRKAGANRFDADLDGFYDQGAAPAIMDAVYPLLADAALAPVLGPQLDQLSSLVGKDNSPNSDFTGGRIWILYKDLSSLLGKPVKQPFTTKFCGGGDITVCRTALWG